MNTVTIKQIMSLLIRVSNNSVQSFFYFPDIIFVGKQKIEKEEFHFLFAEGFITEYKSDSFGRFYKLSAKGEKFIYTTISLRQSSVRRKVKASTVQGCLEFA
jgi:hypothetical protein